LLERRSCPSSTRKNVATRPKSKDRVEFAVKLPGRDGQSQVWLPIDSKFPTTDYQSLIQAQEAATSQASRLPRRRWRRGCAWEARSIRDKYVEPPATTDFCDSLRADRRALCGDLRRPGLFQQLQNEFRVTVCGPVNLIAFLNSLQMGFRTLAIEKRSSEVWEVLGAVKTEFETFGKVLANTKKQLESVANSSSLRKRGPGRWRGN